VHGDGKCGILISGGKMEYIIGTIILSVFAIVVGGLADAGRPD
jgi:hypothetical protein